MFFHFFIKWRLIGSARSWKRSEGLLTRDENVGGIDATTFVNVHSEVGRAGVLKSLLSHLEDISRINSSAPIHVAQEDTHRHEHVGDIEAVVNRIQLDGEPLSV